MFIPNDDNTTDDIKLYFYLLRKKTAYQMKMVSLS